MTTHQAQDNALMEELEAEFAELEALLVGENDEGETDHTELTPKDEQTAAIEVIDLLEQAQAIVEQVRSATEHNTSGDSSNQMIAQRLDSVDSALTAMDTQLASVQQELVTLRQLLTQA